MLSVENWRKSILLSLLAAAIIGSAAASIPLLPCEISGTVTINGDPAPAGTVVVAYMENVEQGRITMTNPGLFGGTGPFDERIIIHGGADGQGKAISFRVNDILVEKTIPFMSGESYRISLEATQSAQPDTAHTPTQTPAPAQTLAPTPTSAPTPVETLAPAPEQTQAPTQTPASTPAPASTVAPTIPSSAASPAPVQEPSEQSIPPGTIQEAAAETPTPAASPWTHVVTGPVLILMIATLTYFRKKRPPGYQNDLP